MEVNQPHALLPISKIEDQESLCVIKPRSWSLGKQVSWWCISPSEKPTIWKLQQMEESWGMRERMNVLVEQKTANSCSLSVFMPSGSLLHWMVLIHMSSDYCYSWLFLCENFVLIKNICFDQIYPKFLPVNFFHAPPQPLFSPNVLYS